MEAELHNIFGDPGSVINYWLKEVIKNEKHLLHEELLQYFKNKKDTPLTNAVKRTFRLLYQSVIPSINNVAIAKHYVGKTPMQAAKKAFTLLARNQYDGHACECTFTIQESTQGSNKKRRTYYGKRVELDEPQTIERNGAQYTVRFSNIVKQI